MSRTSFKAFCAEFYAAHVGKTGPEVYAAFEKSGLLRELDRDYEDLHGLGMEALIDMFDERVGKEVGHQRCEHHLIRTTLIPEIAKLIAGRFGISEDGALDRFYKSATAQNLADEENGLYGQSALFIFGQYLEELAMDGSSACPIRTT
jgi:hypothetical protein